MNAAYQSGLKFSLAGRHGEAIGYFEQALGQAPNDPGILFALGNTAVALGADTVAEDFFRRVLARDPARLEAIVHLANLLRRAGRFETAIGLLEPAVAERPGSPELALTLGSAFREKGDLQTAKIHYRAALAAKPDYGPALANLADLLCDEGSRDQALGLYDKAIKAEPGNAQARMNRAVLHLLAGNLKDGWRDYAARIDIPGKVPAVRSDFRLPPLWTADGLHRKRLLVRGEQGVGDQILFASLIPELAAKARDQEGSILLECEPRLLGLFARSFPGVTVRPWVLHRAGAAIEADYAWLRQAGGATAQILMGSLPRHMRTRLEDFPKPPDGFLKPDAAALAQARQALSPKAVGICWRSGKLGGHRTLEYAPLPAWGAFLKACEAFFVCVQYDATAEEIAQLEQMSGRKILVPPGLDQKNELDRTSALLAGLDMVVSAPTAVACLAASVGTPTLKVLYRSSWTALGQDYEPFLPTCSCIMPQSPGDWADVFGQVAARLSARW